MAKRKRMSVFAQTEDPKLPEPVISPLRAETIPDPVVPHETSKDAISDEFWAIVSTIEVPDIGRSSSIGVGLKPDEHTMLNEIVQETGAARNALVRLAVRRFIQMYRAQMIEIKYEKPSPYSPPTVHKKIKM